MRHNYRPHNYLNLTGKRFGRLVCIKDAGRTKNQQVLWLCKCDCGKETIVPSSSLTTGNTKSCGCLASEILRKRNSIHSLSLDVNGNKTRLFNIWMRMKQRCFDKNCIDFQNYGGRGIKVCDEWLKFKPFYNWAMANGYRDNLSIERIDVNGDYEPNNCKWIPLKAQARNKRNNHYITYNGKTKTLAEWSEILNINYSTLKMRLRNGWDIERAFKTPVRGGSKSGY